MSEEKRDRPPERKRYQGNGPAKPESGQGRGEPGGEAGRGRDRRHGGRGGRGQDRQGQPKTPAENSEGRGESASGGRGTRGSPPSQRQGQNPPRERGGANPNAASPRQQPQAVPPQEGAAGQGRRFGRKRFGRGGRAPETEQQQTPTSQLPRAEAPICPLCQKPVYDLSSAIGSDRETGLPAHFDCVYERVSAAETLAAGEKLVYLGSGGFAVVEFRDGRENAFVVKRRIPWEKEGEKKDWRKAIHSRYTGV